MRFRREKQEEAPAVEETPEPSPPTPGPSYETPLSAQAASEGHDEHPEIVVGAAFVGGLALAQLLKRFGR